MALDEWRSREDPGAYTPARTLTIPGSRLDRKRGRFSVDFETNEIHAALRGAQSVTGDYVDYYRFLQSTSQMDEVYDEGAGEGREYVGPVDLPVWHVLMLEGGQDISEGGLYYRDALHVTLLFDTLEKVGLTHTDFDSHKYLRDRIVYNGKVFRVTKMAVMGAIQQRDIIVSVDCEHVRADEMVGDKQFEDWSA